MLLDRKCFVSNDSKNLHYSEYDTRYKKYYHKSGMTLHSNNLHSTFTHLIQCNTAKKSFEIQFPDLDHVQIDDKHMKIFVSY